MTINQPLMDAERQAVATVLRDWIHETSLSRCSTGADTCPDWPLAYELADKVMAAIDIVHDQSCRCFELMWSGDGHSPRCAMYRRD